MKSILGVLALVFLSLVLSACGSAEPGKTSSSAASSVSSSQPGGIQLSIRNRAISQEIVGSALALVTGDDFAPITNTLTLDYAHNTLSGLITGIPSGTNRTLTINLFNSSNTLVGSGTSSGITILPTVNASVDITIYLYTGGVIVNGTITNAPNTNSGTNGTSSLTFPRMTVETFFQADGTTNYRTVHYYTVNRGGNFTTLNNNDLSYNLQGGLISYWSNTGDTGILSEIQEMIMSGFLSTMFTIPMKGGERLMETALIIPPDRTTFSILRTILPNIAGIPPFPAFSSKPTQETRLNGSA